MFGRGTRRPWGKRAAGCLGVAFIAAVYVSLAAPPSHANTADRLLSNVRKAARFRTVSLHVDMVLVDRVGQKRERSFDWYATHAPGRSKGLIIIDAPDSMKGTKYLVVTQGHRRTQYVYLPSMHRVRRLGVTELGESFLGSDLNYGDLNDHGYRSWHNSILREDLCPEEHVRCAVVQSLPAKQSGGAPPYSRVVQWIRSTDNIPVYATFYRGKVIIKTLRVQATRSVDGHTIATRTIIRNPVTGHSTRIIVSRIVLDRPLADSLFTVRSLEQP